MQWKLCIQLEKSRRSSKEGLLLYIRRDANGCRLILLSLEVDSGEEKEEERSSAKGTTFQSQKEQIKMGSFQDFASCNKVSSNFEMNLIPEEGILCCMCVFLAFLTISQNEREKVIYCSYYST